MIVVLLSILFFYAIFLLLRMAIDEVICTAAKAFHKDEQYKHFKENFRVQLYAKGYLLLPLWVGGIAYLFTQSFRDVVFTAIGVGVIIALWRWIKRRAGE